MPVAVGARICQSKQREFVSKLSESLDHTCKMEDLEKRRVMATSVEAITIEDQPDQSMFKQPKVELNSSVLKVKYDADMKQMPWSAARSLVWFPTQPHLLDQRSLINRYPSFGHRGEGKVVKINSIFWTQFHLYRWT